MFEFLFFLIFVELFMLNLIFLDIDFLLFFMILFKCFKFFGDLLGELYELFGDLLFIELLVLFDEF